MVRMLFSELLGGMGEYSVSWEFELGGCEIW